MEYSKKFVLLDSQIDVGGFVKYIPKKNHKKQNYFEKISLKKGI
jgi:hypothetical protein